VAAGASERPTGAGQVVDTNVGIDQQFSHARPTRFEMAPGPRGLEPTRRWRRDHHRHSELIDCLANQLGHGAPPDGGEGDKPSPRQRIGLPSPGDTGARRRFHPRHQALRLGGPLERVRPRSAIIRKSTRHPDPTLPPCPARALQLWPPAVTTSSVTPSGGALSPSLRVSPHPAQSPGLSARTTAEYRSWSCSLDQGRPFRLGSPVGTLEQ